MNLKKSLVSAVAGLALIGSIAAPAIAAGPPTESNPNNNQTTAHVDITEGGTFDVFFESGNVDFGDLTLTAASPLTTTLTGSWIIGIKDDMSNRPEFNIQVQATNFTSGPNTISANGFKITKTYNVVQDQWGANVGDIGAFAPSGVYPGTQCTGCSWAWTGSNVLSGPLQVNYGNAGTGTKNSHAAADVSLDVPRTTAPGGYDSTLTITVIAGTMP